MASQISEGTLQKTLNRLAIIASSPFPVGYVRIVSNNINYDNNDYTALLGIYYNEETRNTAPNNCLDYFIGCNFSDDDKTLLQSDDDRVFVYKMLEYIINYQYLQKNKPEKTAEQTKEEFQTAYDSYCKSAETELAELAGSLDVHPVESFRTI